MDGFHITDHPNHFPANNGRIATAKHAIHHGRRFTIDDVEHARNTAAYAGDDDAMCCCGTARIWLIVLCSIYIICVIIVGITSRTEWYSIVTYCLVASIVPVITLVGAVLRNRCLLTTSLFCQIISFIFAILLTIMVALLVVFKDRAEFKYDYYYNGRELDEDEKKYWFIGMCIACLVLLLDIIFMMVLTVKTRKNAT